MQNTRIIHSKLLLLCSLVLVTVSACGFHLRGAVELPPEIHSLALEDTSTGSGLVPVIKLQLRRSGIKPLASTEQAKLILTINGESYNRRVLTVSSVGQVQEFELSFNVDYSIQNVADPSASLMRQKLTVKRDLRFAVDEVLGKASEEARLKEDMLRDAAERILKRIPKAARKPDQATSQ
jgi:LPS-assembly lipoprotein